MAKRIRRARKAAGLTQVDLGNAVKVSRETIQNWENNRSELSGNDLVAVERWLKKVEKVLKWGDEQAEEKA